MADSAKGGETEYAQGMCSFLNLPEKDCMPAARKWYRDERHHFLNENSSSGNGSGGT